MFFVFCREKIISYIIALSTVVILLCISAINCKQPNTMKKTNDTVNTKTEKKIIQGE